MSVKIDVIADCSGGMREMGKDDVILNALRAVSAWSKRPENDGCQFDIYLWSEALTRLEKGVKPTFSFQGKANPSVLLEHLDALPDGARVLLFSDGLFPVETLTRKARKKSLLLIPVQIGADANCQALRSLSRVGRVFRVSELFGLMERLCFSASFGEAK